MLPAIHFETLKMGKLRIWMFSLFSAQNQIRQRSTTIRSTIYDNEDSDKNLKTSK